MPKALLTVRARRFKQKMRKNRSIFRSKLASKTIKSGASSSHFLLLFFSPLYLLCRAVRKHLAGMQQVLCKPDDLLGSTPLHAEKELAACRALDAKGEKVPQRGQFLPGLQPHSLPMGQKAGEKWTAAALLQPALQSPTGC